MGYSDEPADTCDRSVDSMTASLEVSSPATYTEQKLWATDIAMIMNRVQCALTHSLLCMTSTLTDPRLWSVLSSQVLPGPPSLDWATFYVVSQVDFSSLTPIEPSTQSCRAWCTGASGESRQMCSNKEWRRSAIMSDRSLRPVFLLTAMFSTWSIHLMPVGYWLHCLTAHLNCVGWVVP